MSAVIKAGVEFRIAVKDANAAVVQVGQIDQAVRSLHTQVDRFSGAIQRVGHYGAGLLALRGAFDFGREVAGTADQMSTLASRIGLVTASSEQQARIQGRLFDVAQDARVIYSELGATYAQIGRSTNALGLSHERLLGVVESISQAMTIGGGSAQSMQAAMAQLSQGLASGTLRGDELNSVLEQTPRLAQAIADGMGIGIGKLRELGGENKLTAQQIVAALEGQADALQAEFDKVQKTIGGGMTQLSNAAALLVGNLNRVSGAGAGLADMLGGVSTSVSDIAQSTDALNRLVAGIKTATMAGAAFVAVGLGRYFADKATALKSLVTGTVDYVAAVRAQQAATAAAATAQAGEAQATLAKTAAAMQGIAADRAAATASLQRANASVAASTAAIAAARAAGAQSFALATLRSAEQALTAALAQRTAATTALAALGTQQAQARGAEAAATAALAAAEGRLAAARGAGAAAATLGARALGFLGGPIGAVTTLLSLGATAWALWGGAARDGEAVAKGEVRRSTEQVIDDLDKQIAKLRERNELARLAAKGGVNPGDHGAADYARALADYQDAIAGRGKYASLQGAARESVIKVLGQQFGELAGKMRELKNEQGALDLGGAFGKAQKAAEDFDAKFATQHEKLGVAFRETALALGDLFTPERKQALIDSFIKPTKEAASEASRFRDELDGQAASLREQVIEMNAGKDAVLAWRAAQLGMTRQTAATRAELERLRGALEAQKAAEKAAEDSMRSRLRSLDAINGQVSASEKAIQALADERLALTQGKQALEALTEARLEEAAAAAERQALALEMEGSADIEVARLRTLAQLKRAEAAQRRALAIDQGNKEAADAAVAEWQRASDQIGQSLSDALMSGGQSAAQSLVNLFKTIVLRPVIQAIVSPVAGAVTSMMGFSGAAGASNGGASMLGSLGSGLSLLGGVGGFSTALGGGLGAVMGGAGLGNVLGASGTAIGAGLSTGSMGTAAAGLGMGIGAAIPIVGAILAGMKLSGSLYGRGWSADSLSLKNPLTSLSAAETGLLKGLGVNDKWANILTGAPVVARFFGRALKDAGVQGSLSGSGEGDFSGKAFRFYKGGYFRSDKTKTSALDPQFESVLDAGTRASVATIRSYAKTLGLPAEAVEGFTQKIKLSLKGLSDEKIQEKLTQTFADFGEGLAARYKTALQPLQHAGESLTQTLQRLVTLQTFSDQLNDLGGVFGRLARLSVDAREGLIEMAGGMDALKAQTMQYAQEYLSREEIAGLKAGELRDTLQGAGLSTDLRTRDDFRALVDGLDVSSAAGRKQLAALLSVAGSATQVFDFQAETGGSLNDTAALAPHSDALAGLFGPGGQLEQLHAINNVTSSVDRVHEAVVDMKDSFLAALGLSYRPAAPQATEVNAVYYERN